MNRKLYRLIDDIIYVIKRIFAYPVDITSYLFGGIPPSYYIYDRGQGELDARRYEDFCDDWLKKHPDKIIECGKYADCMVVLDKKFDMNELVESVEDDCTGDGICYLPSELRIAKRVYADFISFRENALSGENSVDIENIKDISNSFPKWLEYQLKLCKEGK